MTDKWTPGPWHLEPMADGWGLMADGHPDVAFFDATDADARLIAAAPELVEALRGLVAPYTIIRQGSTGSIHTGAPPRAALDAARALLDRIEKEANGD